ncbi:response regulator transcription factor [Cohaesibacter celericrescens]|uniref:Cell cycle response regulator CtrA n=1 Tax=Cohaesibacter celericrescens TaxID=2067669 RepID=A0A2N5XMX7_9HYPH|nr:response regulator transcription factor [Cohaesibacter celericrescens]PLW75768.1 DNA-binding response regulator [Cohaesibacter celericrescens]
MKILVVEDERKIADIICAGLTDNGFDVTHCADGHSGYKKASEGDQDLIVLDIMLPGRDGLDILRSIRKEEIDTPVILLTARNELGDRIKGLEQGADDYLAKPFYVEELVARILALQRRHHGVRRYSLQMGALRLDCIARQAGYNDQNIDLTSREFNLLEYLMRSAGQVFSRGQILEHVWGYDFDPGTNVVDVCIKRIRKKIAAIDEAGDLKHLIESVRGTGYRIPSE